MFNSSEFEKLQQLIPLYPIQWTPNEIEIWGQFAGLPKDCIQHLVQRQITAKDLMQGNDDPDVFFAKNDITKWFAAKSKLKIWMDRGFKNYAEFLQKQQKEIQSQVITKKSLNNYQKEYTIQSCMPFEEKKDQFISEKKIFQDKNENQNFNNRYQNNLSQISEYQQYQEKRQSQEMDNLMTSNVQINQLEEDIKEQVNETVNNNNGEEEYNNQMKISQFSSNQSKIQIQEQQKQNQELILSKEEQKKELSNISELQKQDDIETIKIAVNQIQPVVKENKIFIKIENINTETPLPTQLFKANFQSFNYFQPKKKKKIKMTSKLIKIGRHSASQIKIENENISRQHAEIIYNSQKQQYFIQDLGSGSGTFHRISESYQLNIGAIFQCGLNEFMVQNIQITDTEALLTLFIGKGINENSKFSIAFTNSKVVAIIGASETADISLQQDCNLNSIHTKLYFRSMSIFLEDQNTKNGT